MNRKIATLRTFGSALNKMDQETMVRAGLENPWFNEANVMRALKAWQKALVDTNLEKWLTREPSLSISVKKPLSIGLICAGNIPLVGLHDLICIWLSGHKGTVKLSSDDAVLMRWCMQKLNELSGEEIFVEADRLKNPDAVIATGSNNTGRYFEYYFGKYPHIIRKNRNSVALLTGHETSEELALLGDDLFSYFGLGCRNVTHLLVPEGYEFTKFFEAIEKFNGLIHHNRYANNYTYHKALMLMNLDPFLDNGFLLLREHELFYSALSVLHYSFYKTQQEAVNRLSAMKESLQVVVSGASLDLETQQVGFGLSQAPDLWDYADGVNTIQFLTALP